MSPSLASKMLIPLMVLLLFLSQACTDLFLPGLPMMAKDFHASIPTINLTLSAYNYSQAFFVLFIGVISDLMGRRPTLLFCLFLQIMASLCIATSDSITVVIFMRIIQALGSACIYIVLRLLIKDIMTQKEQIHVTGLLVIGLVLSPLLAPSIGAWLIHYFNWRACFWAIGITEIPLFFWSLWIIQETHHHQKEYRTAFTLKNLFHTYYTVLKNLSFLGAALMVGCTFGAFYGFISISSFLYIEQYHMSLAHYGYIFIAIALSYLIGNRIMSTLNAKNTPPEKIILLGMITALCGTALILIELFFSQHWIILSSITFGICFIRLSTALINPPIQVTLMNHFHKQGSHALGLLTSIQYCFAALATSFVSILPFQPTGNLMISTAVFIMGTLLGYPLVTHYLDSRK